MKIPTKMKEIEGTITNASLQQSKTSHINSLKLIINSEEGEFFKYIPGILSMREILLKLGFNKYEIDEEDLQVCIFKKVKFDLEIVQFNNNQYFNIINLDVIGK